MDAATHNSYWPANISRIDVFDGWNTSVVLPSMSARVFGAAKSVCCRRKLDPTLMDVVDDEWENAELTDAGNAR